jgi:hypothetical protein
MNPTLFALIVALVLGIAADAVVTKATKVGWLGTVIGMGVFVAAAIVGLGVA